MKNMLPTFRVPEAPFSTLPIQAHLEDLPKLPGSDSVFDGSVEYVYVNGYINAEFDNTGLEKEFERSLISTDSDGKTTLYMPANASEVTRKMRLNDDSERERYLYEFLSNPEHYYIARDMVWTITNIFDDNVYSLRPAPNQIKVLIEAIKPGKESRKATPVSLLGEAFAESYDKLPILQIKKTEMISPSSIVSTVKSKTSGFSTSSVQKVVGDILSLAENEGDSDQDRALNYALNHNLEMYIGACELIYNAHGHSSDREVAQLSNISVFHQMSGKRRIAKIVFDFQNVKSSVGQYWYSAVDVTDEYPFLLVPFKRYLPRY